MKNLFILLALMITLTASSQARVGVSVQEIYNEFKELGIIYVPNTEYDSFLLFYPDPNVSVQYYFDNDSICTSMLISTFTKEMTDFIIGNYTRKGYTKTNDGWLMKDDGAIFIITHTIKEDNTNLFYWY
jgi:hypothetical protein